MQVVFKLALISLWLTLLMLAAIVPSLADSGSEVVLPTYTASPSANRPRVITPTPTGSVKSTSSVTPSVSPSPSVTMSPTPTIVEQKGGLVCESLEVVMDDEVWAPVDVTFRVRVSGGTPQGYRYNLGSGVVKEAETSELVYRYEEKGSYGVMAEVKDGSGAWISSQDCVGLVSIGKQLEVQPETGAPLVALVLTGVSGVMGVGLMKMKRLVN